MELSDCMSTDSNFESSDIGLNLLKLFCFYIKCNENKEVLGNSPVKYFQTKQQMS